MFKFLTLTFILGFSLMLNAQNISSNKERDLANEVKVVIKQILKDERAYRKLDKLILKSNDKITKNQTLLDDMNEKKNLLEEELSDLQKEQKAVESNIITLTVKRYSKSMAIKYANKKSSKSIVDNEVYVILHNSIKKEVGKYNKISKVLTGKISSKIALIRKLNIFKKEQEKLILSNQKLKNTQEKNIKSLRKEHRFYVSKLEEMNKDQEKMKDILSDLSLVKSGKKNKNSKVKNISPSGQEFESAVNDISKNSTSVVALGYKGKKTIAPFKRYEITSKFGKYYDKVYKAELFSKSVSLKTKSKNTRVRSMLDGKIFFIRKDAGRLKNIVIVEHDNGLNTIYSNLNTISSKIFTGKKVLKGSTLGRVDNTLILQATKNNRYINPEKLFK